MIQSKTNWTDPRSISHLIAARGDPNAVIAAEIGPRFLEYRRAWDEAAAFRRRPPFPVQVDFEPLFACNLACPICIMSLPAQDRNRFGDPARRLDFDAMRAVLDDGAAHGQWALGLNGICEPLLAPELPEVIAYARSVGLVDVMFNTNGLLLSEKISRKLIQAGLTRLMISLDAVTPEVYERVRVGSDLERVTENVRRFVRLRDETGSRLPVVRVSFCVTSINEHQLGDFVRQWSPVVDFFSIQHYGNTFDGDHAADRARLFADGHRYDPGPAPRCAQPNQRVMVRHNGDVVPCCDASGLNLVIGNIGRQSLKDIWDGPAARRIQDVHQQGRWASIPICRACMTKWGPGPEEAPSPS
jgi:radical SAM protein with 4Fe4S-binding SPASM domain